jgi:hypothetical protein
MQAFRFFVARNKPRNKLPCFVIETICGAFLDR